MNIYTTEEIKELLSELIHIDIDGTKKFLIRYNGSTDTISYLSVLGTIFVDPVININECLTASWAGSRKLLDELIKIREFIYYAPFFQVPLYLNVYPEISAWRLKIGK